MEISQTALFLGSIIDLYCLVLIFTRMATLSERRLLQSYFSIYAEINPASYCPIA